MEIQFESTLKNIIDQNSLKWIFVGGKGGVGKTTTASSLAVLLAESGKRVLIISTDPAHNLSDCFDQKFNGKEPIQVNGVPNLAGLEIDPKIDPDKIKNITLEGIELPQIDQATQSFLSEIISSVPGIDEAMSFAQLMNSLEDMKFDLIVFDTAPTGHTLRLLNFPNLLEKGLEKIITLKQKFANIIGTVSTLFGNQQQIDVAYQKVFLKVEQMKVIVDKVSAQLKQADKTTFIAVCIPEFLSLYETERLVQELAKYQIDIHNIVINQVVYPEQNCKMCLARAKMQKKYISQMLELYNDMHIVIMPQQEEEVRGVSKLKIFNKLLLNGNQAPVVPQ